MVLVLVLHINHGQALFRVTFRLLLNQVIVLAVQGQNEPRTDNRGVLSIVRRHIQEDLGDLSQRSLVNWFDFGFGLLFLTLLRKFHGFLCVEVLGL